MARGHLIVVLWLGVAAASSKSAASERRADASEAPRDSRRLSKEDHRTFRGKLDPPNNGRGRHHVFVHIPKAAGGSWMRASPNWMSRKDIHGLHLLEETSSKCERATGMRVLCPAKRDRMWAAALKDACAVHNDGGEAYNHTCTYTV